MIFGDWSDMDEKKKAVISAAILLMVNIAALFGVNLSQGALTDAICAIVTAAATLYAAWKNHNFTAEAAQAQMYLNDLKKGVADGGER